MFQRFQRNRRNREIVDGIYAAIVTRARNPRLYADFGVPDTVMGRYEAVSLHLFLLLERCRDDERLKPLAQDLVDRFMVDIDQSIRELGIGDPSVPKRMRRLAGRFYERVNAYDAALAASDRDALAAVLVRRVLPPSASGDAAAGLATYMLDERTRLGRLSSDDILAGRMDEQAG